MIAAHTNNSTVATRHNPGVATANCMHVHSLMVTFGHNCVNATCKSQLDPCVYKHGALYVDNGEMT